MSATIGDLDFGNTINFLKAYQELAKTPDFLNKWPVLGGLVTAMEDGNASQEWLNDVRNEARRFSRLGLSPNVVGVLDILAGNTGVYLLLSTAHGPLKTVNDT
jgi:hypothetical protein